MNYFTTRCSTPAAAPRPCCVRAALPADTGLDDLLADPDIGSTAKTIAIALVKQWAWSKDHCWPSDQTIAKKIGKSPGHVQRCLHQLELAGYIRRECTPETPTGRRIWLLWRCREAGAGAQPSPAPARTTKSAPARSKQVVVVEREEAELEEVCQAPQRQRPEPPATASPNPPAPLPLTVKIPERLAAMIGLADRSDPPPAPISKPTTHAGLFTTAPMHDRPAGTKVIFPSNWPKFREAPPARAATKPAPSPPRPTTATPPDHGALPVVLTEQEQVRLRELPEPVRDQVLCFLAAGDRVCVGEARRLLKPPPPPEPPPCSMPMAELLLGLPGRLDRVTVVAGRLASELGDVRSFDFYRLVAESVCAGQQPPEVLLSAWRQATGPKAARPGAVFATAWKRETG